MIKKTFLTLLVALAAMSVSAQHGEYVGGDISDLPLYETHNSGYLDGNGNKINDLITWLKDECGWNAFRVRLFVNPNFMSKDGKSSDLTVCQDLDYVKKLGKRIKDAGAQFMLDFHYSDTWADPTYQTLPSAWSSCTTVDAKAEKLYAYTKDCLEQLTAYGAKPDLVQVGNEITSGIVGVWRSNNAAGFKQIVERGCDAVRATCPDAKIIIHIERPQNTANVLSFYNALDQSKYDVIGLSYYPMWHGYLSQLNTTLTKLKSTFPNKKVQIVETAYNFQYWPTEGVKTDTRGTWACSIDGQYKFIKALIADLADYDNVNGLFYWCPEEAGCGDDSTWGTGGTGATVMGGWLNRGLWYLDQTTTGHWPLKAADGMVHYLFKDFLDPTLAGVTSITADQKTNDNRIYTINGQYVGKDTKNLKSGIYIQNNKKTIIR